MRTRAARREIVPSESPPWTLDLKGFSVTDPSVLVKLLTGTILSCGGWVLSRGANDTGAVCMMFEFERRLCIEIYGALMSAGIDLNSAGHMRFTELCRCTQHHFSECGQEIASVELEVQTLPAEGIGGSFETHKK